MLATKLSAASVLFLWFSSFSGPLETEARRTTSRSNAFARDSSVPSLALSLINNEQKRGRIGRRNKGLNFPWIRCSKIVEHRPDRPSESFKASELFKIRIIYVYRVINCAKVVINAFVTASMMTRQEDRTDSCIGYVSRALTLTVEVVFAPSGILISVTSGRFQK